MAPPRITKSLASADAGYIAGLVDGEGTVTLSRLHRNERHYALAAIGAGKITSKRTYDLRHAASYTYQISSRQALDLLRESFEAELLAIGPRA